MSRSSEILGSSQIETLAAEIERKQDQGQPVIDLQKKMAKLTNARQPVAPSSITAEDFIGREQIESNIAHDLPVNFIPERHPDPINRRTETSPRYRPARKKVGG